MNKRKLVPLSIVGLLAAGLLMAEANRAGPRERVAFHADFESGNLNAWQFPFPEDWALLSEDGNHYLHMKRNREPRVPRRPLQCGLLKEDRVGSFEFDTLLRGDGTS